VPDPNDPGLTTRVSLLFKEARAILLAYNLSNSIVVRYLLTVYRESYWAVSYSNWPTAQGTQGKLGEFVQCTPGASELHTAALPL
jgi:hypothetical protein